MKKILLGCLGLLVLGGIIVAISAMASYNRLVGLEENTDSTWSQVQNLYQRRFELIPNLVETVKGAANFEKSTITEVTEARASVGRMTINAAEAPKTAAELQAFEQAQGQLSSALSRLLVVAERYPELKATQNFRDLQVQLEGTENRIAVARRDFNLAVQKFNTTVRRFPGNIWARMLGFETKPYFQSTPGAESAPKVDFQ